MGTSFGNPQASFADMAFSLGRDPASWERWSCLQLTMPGEAAHPSVESCIRSNFGHLDGRMFTMGKNVYIVCRNISAPVLNELGRQVCMLRLDGRTAFCGYYAYDLGADADLFLANLSEHGMGPHAAAEIRRVRTETEPGGKRILLVEDDPLSRRLFSNALGGKYGFAAATSGGMAFDLYESWKPHIVFLDIGLPDRDGFSVLRWLMARDHAAHIVMLSGHGNLDNIAAAIEQGAQGFISKPFRPEQVIRYIEKYDYPSSTH